MLALILAAKVCLASAPSPFFANSFVITGFNTDIEHDGVTYHVQTEDKGLSKPVIISLVYNGGTILASKRSPYDDLLKANFSERILAERLSKQHKLICAAIRAGRIEDLKRLNERDRKQVPTPKPLPLPSEPVITSPVAKLQMPPADSLEEFKAVDQPIPKPAFKTEETFDQNGLIDEPIIEAVAIIEDDLILPADAVEIIDAPDITARPDHNKLSIEILGDVKFRGGERNSVGFMVSRGTSRKVVPAAEIMVKILGSSFRPVIFHALTDMNGVATVNMQMPTFNTGRAAFLVRAMSDGEEVELRRSIAHG